MKFGPSLDAPTLLDYLEGTGVGLRVDGGDIVYEASREITESEIQDLRRHKPALLDVLAAKDLPPDGSDVVPALRAYLLEKPHTAHFEPQFLAANLYIFSHLRRQPSRNEVRDALEALSLEEAERMLVV